MKRPSSTIRCMVFAALAALVSAAGWVLPATSSAGAATTAGTVIGEGGDAMTPVMVKLLHDDAAGLDPDFASYTNVDLDQGIADFVGTAPGTFANDFAVSERPLTSAEAATAKANGRSYAYVPFAATPVALLTMVPSETFQGSATIQPDQFCQHIPLSLDQLDGIYGQVSPTYSNWGDARLTCSSTSSTPPEAYAFGLWGNLDPTMENYALESLLDSTPASEAAYGAGLATAQKNGLTATSNPAASEAWPYSGKAVEGGDEATLGRVIDLDARTSTPSAVAADIQLGAIMALSSVWTGDPLGVTWDLPTAAVENAASAFVPPSAGAATAAEADATLAATSDPTTNNLVTFNASSTDATAYNNYLMMESYLVVPTNGLPADKALALAQFIRFAVGTKGQADITSLGAAPATSKMVTADLAVAQTLDVEAATAPATPSSTTTSTTTTTTTPATATGTSGSGSAALASTSAASTGNSGNSGSGSSLASTGGDPKPLFEAGLILVVFAESARQILKRQRVRRRKSRA
jgi:hypothetical protein